TASWVARSEHLRVRDDPARVCAADPGERLADDLFPRAAVRVLDEPCHDLRVERRVEGRALLLELATQRVRVQQVAVVRDGTWAELRVMERQRVGILGATRAGGRVSGVAEREDRSCA